MFNYGLTSTQITAQVQSVLIALRDALDSAQDLHAWTSGLAVSDLVSVGYSSADAQSILNAVADANSLAQLYNGGTFGGTLPYNFSASQRQVIGPQ